MATRKNDKHKTGFSSFVDSLSDEFVNPEVSKWEDLGLYLDRLEQHVIDSGVSTSTDARSVVLEVMEHLGIPLELWFRTLLSLPDDPVNR